MFRIASGLLVAMSFCLAAKPACGQALQVCAQPGLAFGDAFTPAVLTETANVPANLDLAMSFIEIYVDVTHPSIGELTVTLESPLGTSITLHDALGGTAADLLLRWEENAPPNGPPYDCNCSMQPSGPGTCEDFRAESAAGDWLLEFSDNVPAAIGGTLNEWCIDFFAYRPVAVDPCSFPVVAFGSTGLPASVSDLISIPHNFVLDHLEVRVVVPHAETSDLDIAVTSPSGTTVTLHDNAGSGAGGVVTTFSSAGQANGPPYVCACVMQATGPGLMSDFAGEQAAGDWRLTCTDSTPLADSGSLDQWCVYGYRLPDHDACAVPQVAFGDVVGLPPLVTSTMTVAPSLEIGDVEVRVDAIHNWIGDIRIDVTSPAGTNVVLHDQTGGASVGIIAGYSDFGRAPTVVHLCSCFYPPAGPGVLLDYYQEIATGVWTLTCEDVIPITSQGVLSDWCVRFYEKEDVFLRGDADGNGMVFGLIDAVYLLQWSFVGGPAPVCEDAADADGNNTINGLLDALYLLTWGFLGGPPPPMPGTTYCGPDDDLDPLLDCATGLVPRC